ncbi:MAG: sortase [Oscillospiraceae bacterium]|nr:sortase [Oscillospiraceae bacterium]
MGKKQKMLILAGMVLIGLSAGLLVFTQLFAANSRSKAQRIVSQIEAQLPTPHPGVPDSFLNPQMSVLSLKEGDFCALVEIPAYGLTLPVEDIWNSGSLQTYPCRYYGSVDSGDLVIGGSDQEGQFDFFDQLNNGAQIRLTDMTGRVFTYTVVRIDRFANVNEQYLISRDYPLTLFVRDQYSLDYLLVRCVLGR